MPLDDPVEGSPERGARRGIEKGRVAALTGILLLGVVLRAKDVSRPGYSPDEEITALAVQGVRAHGIPSLPSGAFYERGLPYSYLAWLSGAVFGNSIPAYRWPSTIFGLLAALAVYVLAARLSHRAALFAALLMCISPVMVTVSQWARFYTMFLFFYIVTVYLADAARSRPAAGALFLVSLGATRLLHEMALTLLAVPLFYYFVDEKDAGRRRYDLALLAGAVLVLGGIQLAVYGAHQWISDPTMQLAEHHSEIHRTSTLSIPLHPIVRRAPLPAVVLLAGAALGLPWLSRSRRPLEKVCLSLALLAAALLQLGALLFLSFFLAVAWPERRFRILGLALGIGTVATVCWTVLASSLTLARLDVALLGSIALGGIAHSMAAIFYFARLWPVASLMLLLLPFVAERARGADGSGELLRTSWVAAWVGFLFLGVLQTGLRPRYFLYPLGIVMAAAPLLPALLRGRRIPMRPAVQYALALLLGTALVVEQQRGLQEVAVVASGSFWTYAHKDFPVEQWRDAVGPLDSDTVLFCGDPLACVYVFGRADYWILTGTIDVARFSVTEGERRRGVYAGAEVLTSLEAAANRVREAAERSSVLVLLAETGKFGSVAPEALAKELGAHPSLHVTVERVPYLAILRVRRIPISP